jgi:hypothetical protein
MSAIPPLPEILKQQLIASTACQYAGSLLEVLACGMLRPSPSLGVFRVAHLCTGIQVFMVAQGYLAYASQPQSAAVVTKRKPYIVISFVILLVSLVTTVAGAYENGRTMMRDTDLITYGFILRTGPMPWWINLSQTGLFLIVAIADGLLVGAVFALLVAILRITWQMYRCYIIWGTRISVVLFPGLIYVAYLGMILLMTLSHAI